jgi:hypothetical protein
VPQAIELLHCRRQAVQHITPNTLDSIHNTLQGFYGQSEGVCGWGPHGIDGIGCSDSLVQVWNPGVQVDLDIGGTQLSKLRGGLNLLVTPAATTTDGSNMSGTAPLNATCAFSDVCGAAHLLCPRAADGTSGLSAFKFQVVGLAHISCAAAPACGPVQHPACLTCGYVPGGTGHELHRCSCEWLAA